MNVENPFSFRKQELLRKAETDKSEAVLKEIAELEFQEQQFLWKTLDGLGLRKVKIEDSAQEVIFEHQHGSRNKTRLYKVTLELFRESLKLTQELRELKKMIKGGER